MNRLKKEISVKIFERYTHCTTRHYQEIVHSHANDTLNQSDCSNKVGAAFRVRLAQANKSEKSKLKNSSLKIMNTDLSRAKSRLYQLIEFRKLDINKTLNNHIATSLISQSKKVWLKNRSLSECNPYPVKTSDSIGLLISEQLTICKGLILSSKQMRITAY